jgi:hypothetical protein
VEKAHPLTALTNKNAQWKWGKEERHAFNCIKQCLKTKSILGYPDFTREMIIYTDASGYTIGAALAQMQNPALPANRKPTKRIMQNLVTEKEHIHLSTLMTVKPSGLQLKKNVLLFFTR